MSSRECFYWQLVGEATLKKYFKPLVNGKPLSVIGYTGGQYGLWLFSANILKVVFHKTSHIFFHMEDVARFKKVKLKSKCQFRNHLGIWRLDRQLLVVITDMRVLDFSIIAWLHVWGFKDFCQSWIGCSWEKQKSEVWKVGKMEKDNLGKWWCVFLQRSVSQLHVW